MMMVVLPERPGSHRPIAAKRIMTKSLRRHHSGFSPARSGLKSRFRIDSRLMPRETGSLLTRGFLSRTCLEALP